MEPGTTSTGPNRHFNHQVSVRLNREDWALLRDYASARGLRLTQLLRSCALDRALGDTEQAEVPQ